MQLVFSPFFFKVRLVSLWCGFVCLLPCQRAFRILFKGWKSFWKFKQISNFKLVRWIWCSWYCMQWYSKIVWFGLISIFFSIFFFSLRMCYKRVAVLIAVNQSDLLPSVPWIIDYFQQIRIGPTWDHNSHEAWVIDVTAIVHSLAFYNISEFILW